MLLPGFTVIEHEGFRSCTSFDAQGECVAHLFSGNFLMQTPDNGR